MINPWQTCRFLGMVVLIAHLLVPMAAHSLDLPAAANAAPGSSLTEGQGPATEVRAQITAIQHSTISAELNGKIISLPWREGQVVKQGQSLVKFDCGVYNAQLEEAKAQQKETAVNLDVQKRLSNLKASSELEVQQAQARLEQAQARVALHQTQVDHCEIVAPFSGRIGVVSHQAHEVVAPGEKLIELVSDRELEVEMIVPSSSLKSLHKGTRFVLQLAEMTQPITAEIDRTGGLIDPVSESVRIFGKLINAPAGLIPGMSGLARFEAQ